MPTPDQIRQATEDRIRRQNEAATRQERATLQAAITGLLAVLHTIAQELVTLRRNLEMADAKLNDWFSKHPEFTRSTFSPSYLIVTALILFLVYLAAYWLDTLLLSHNARLLVKDFAQGNQTLIYLAIFGVPLVILLIETYFQTQWSAAQTTGQKWLWGILAVLMCLAIPLTVVGFSMAASSAKAGTRAAVVENWQLIGKAFLAFFAHSAILLGGNRLHEAKSYLIFKVTEKSLTRSSRRLTRRINLAEVNLTNQFNEYFRQFTNFNTTYLQNQIEPGPFNQLTRAEINRVFGFVIIAEPPANPPVANGGGVNAGGGVPNNPSIPNLPINQDVNNGLNNGNGVVNTPPLNDLNQNNQPNGNNFNFNMDGEDEVRP